MSENNGGVDADPSAVEMAAGLSGLSGRIQPLVIWPTTRLTTLIANALGFSKLADLPVPLLSNLATFMSPVCYLFIFDVEKITPQDLRHSVREGRMLRLFRATCRRFCGKEDEQLEEHFRAIGDMYLTWTSGCVEGAVPDCNLDQMVEDAMTIHNRMTPLLMAYYADMTKMSGVARQVFMASGGGIDMRLPVHLRPSAQAAEKAEIQRAARGGQGGGGGWRDRQEEAAGENGRKRPRVDVSQFWCHACQKAVPKSDREHRNSKEHLAKKGLSPAGP